MLHCLLVLNGLLLELIFMLTSNFMLLLSISAWPQLELFYAELGFAYPDQHLNTNIMNDWIGHAN